MKLRSIVIVFLFILFVNKTYAQRGYQKDSLQIKVYTEIKYENYRAQDIRVTKVFCDYCSELQTTKIKEEAKRIGFRVRNNRDNIIEKGIKKLAMYIRVSKKDFAALREEEPDN